MPPAAGQDQWEDVTPGPVKVAAAKAVAAKPADQWEDVTPQAQTAPPPAADKPGFFRTVAQDIGHMFDPINPYSEPYKKTDAGFAETERIRREFPSMTPQQQEAERAKLRTRIEQDRPVDLGEQERRNYQSRLTAGQSMPRAIAETTYEAGSGANMVGFDESLKEGNVPQALGHAAAPVVLGAATHAVARIPEVPELARAGVEAVGDTFQSAKDSIGRAVRVEPAVDTVTTRGTLDKPKSPSTLKPGIKAVASLGKLVGGPEVINAVLPDHPNQIGPFSRIPEKIKIPKAVDLDAGAASAVPDVNVVPEPRELLPGDRPGSKWSIKRSELPAAAQRGIPGAGDVIQNLGKTVIYEPREGVGYPGPREAVPLGDTEASTPKGVSIVQPNETNANIQRVNGQMVQEFAGEIESAMKSVENTSPEVAQILRDVRDGKYNAHTNLASFLRKLNETDAADAIESAARELSGGEVSGGSAQRTPNNPAPRQATQQAAQLGPQSTPQSIVESAGAKFVGIQKGYGVRSDQVLFQVGDRGTTLSLDADKVTAEAVRQKIQSSSK